MSRLYVALSLFLSTLPIGAATITNAVVDEDAVPLPTVELSGSTFGASQGSGRVIQVVGGSMEELNVISWANNSITAEVADLAPGTYLFAVVPTNGAIGSLDVTLGAVGPQGPPGPAVGGYSQQAEVSDPIQLAPGESFGEAVECASGLEILGGGCNVLLPNTFSLTISAPTSSPHGWFCGVTNFTNATELSRVLITAVCADVD